MVKAYAACNLTELSCSAYRVLMRMAASVYDRESESGADDEHMYYQGWKSLTVVLGYGITDEDEPLPPAAKRTIARAIKELREAGLIELPPRKHQRRHWNRAYRLVAIPARFYT